jgi:uncharacterized membrane protein
MLLIDSIFLWSMSSIFKQKIQQIQGSPLHIYYRGIIPCYLFLLTALNYFILYPHKSVAEAFLLGLCIYGVYETTNYAIFKDWTLSMVIMDTLWGGILFASVTYLTYQLNKFI